MSTTTLAGERGGAAEHATWASGSALQRAALLALVLAIVATALWPSLSGELVYDDLWLVARNPALQSLERLPEALTAAHWDVADPEQAARVGYWRPLTSIALFVGRALGGGAPWAFHALSLALHLLATVLAFLLAERLTRNAWIALSTALLFGLHPVQVEAVAWISAVNDPLSGVLVLAALLAYLHWRERGSQGVPVLAVSSFAVALFAKESAIAWFPLALALDVGRPAGATAGRFRPLARAFVPALGVVVVYWLARVAVFGDLAGGFDRITSHLDLTFAREISLRLELLGGATLLVAWPAQLNLFREVRPEIPANDAQLWLALLAIAVWALASFVAWKRGARVALAALLVIPAAVAPAFLRVEAIGRFPLSERFLYLSVFGMALLAATCVSRWLPRVPASLAVAVLAIACGVRAHARTAFWHDEATLFRESAAASPRSMYVQWGHGRVLLGEFQRTLDLRALDAARAAFESAQDLVDKQHDPSVLVTLPDILQANLGLAWCYVFCALYLPDECLMSEAEMIFRGILQRYPDSEEAHCGLGVALRYQDKLDPAEQSFRDALARNPVHHESWFNLGRLSLAREKWSDALEQFDRCVKLAPDDVDALVLLAMAAIESGAMDRARTALSRARQLAAHSAEPLVQLGVLAAREQRFETAVDFFEQALAIDGSRGDAFLLLAKAQLQTGEVAAAITTFQSAIRWLQEPPRDPALAPVRAQQLFEALYNLAAVLIPRGQAVQALPFLKQALAMQPEGPYAAQIREQIEAIEAAAVKPSGG